MTTWRIEIYIEQELPSKKGHVDTKFGEFHIDMQNPPRSWNGDSVAQVMYELLTEMKKQRERKKEAKGDFNRSKTTRTRI